MMRAVCLGTATMFVLLVLATPISTDSPGWREAIQGQVVLSVLAGVFVGLALWPW